jgi:hypothetical protein
MGSRAGRPRGSEKTRRRIGSEPLVDRWLFFAPHRLVDGVPVMRDLLHGARGRQRGGFQPCNHCVDLGHPRLQLLDPAAKGVQLLGENLGLVSCGHSPRGLPRPARWDTRSKAAVALTKPRCERAAEVPLHRDRERHDVVWAEDAFVRHAEELEAAEAAIDWGDTDAKRKGVRAEGLRAEGTPSDLVLPPYAQAL